MRTTLNLDDRLLREAGQLSGIKEKTALIHRGLQSLVAVEHARRLAMLGATQRRLSVPRRRRPGRA
jgi:hypothetical protein